MLSVINVKETQIITSYYKENNSALLDSGLSFIHSRPMTTFSIFHFCCIQNEALLIKVELNNSLKISIDLFDQTW